MKVVLWILVAVGALLALFVAWRYTSVARGEQSVNEALLQRIGPIAERLDRGEPVAQETVEQLARSPEVRGMLVAVLKHFGRMDLFPASCMTRNAEAEGILAQWLMHPNELEGAPVAMELVAAVDRHVLGRDATFLVFKYRMPAGHWAGSDWLLGVVGPFYPSAAPYESGAGGFSRAGDVYGKLTPEELVDWYIKVVMGKLEGGP